MNAKQSRRLTASSMSALPLVAAMLFAPTQAHAQFTYLKQIRSVSATAVSSYSQYQSSNTEPYSSYPWSYLTTVASDQHEKTSPADDFGLFSEAVEASASNGGSTGWTSSQMEGALDPGGIRMSASLTIDRNVDQFYFGTNMGPTRAMTNMYIEFELAQPITVLVSSGVQHSGRGASTPYWYPSFDASLRNNETGDLTYLDLPGQQSLDLSAGKYTLQVGGRDEYLFVIDDQMAFTFSMTAVPEASTSSLMALGLAGLFAIRQRRRVVV